MLPSMVLMSALAATAFGANTTYTYTFPAGFNIGLVKPDQLSSWCQGQRNECPSICNGSTTQNTCEDSTLKFNCICADGSVPDVSPYIETVPFYVCEETYGQCINAHPNDAEGQRACKAAATCGSKNASAEDTTMSATTSAASSTLAMATSTGSSQTSSSVAAASTTTNAAAALSGLEGYSTGFMAGAMFLAVRLFL
ncbi:uncharacterized protein N7458_006263 [Penicillium daleae]|uniref:DUF7707 domain-containing protein n=1 Tax=Penicillium daleae TaxID=63821 RepID=A0AAD6G1W2_9EURO|nr:uncharacterized protein N7458_006263 [Penicillium daleae]KAJ5449814.1 hypothetical protein N7458_006263 [Penicillium daleae]